MNDRQRRAAQNGSGDEPLLRALRELGTDYEPDLAAITRRIEGVPSSQSHPGQPHPGQPHPVRRREQPAAPGRLVGIARHSRPVLLPAAAVLLVIGGVVLVTAQKPDPATGPAAGGEVTAGPTTTTAPTPSRTPTAGPSRIGTAVSATQAPTTTTTKAPTPSPRASAAKVSVQPLPAEATVVDLSRPAPLDWLALGTRSDLKQVRAKAGAANPLVTVEQPAQAVSVTGPFHLSWSDGVPEQDHVDAREGLAVPARPGVKVTVAASASARTVQIYAGTVGTEATVSVSGDGITTGRTRLGAESPLFETLLITVSLPPTSGPTEILLRGSASNQALSQVFLAGVVLR